MREKIVLKIRPPAINQVEVRSLEPLLPYPNVYYPPLFSGTFMGLQRNGEEDICLCSCQRAGIKAYLDEVGEGKHNHRKEALSLSLSHIPFEELSFRDNLCHICNKVCPHYSVSDSKSITKFKGIYGFYIRAQAFEYVGTGKSLCTSAFVISTNGFTENDSLAAFMEECENAIRDKIGYHRIRRKWKQESKLLDIVKELYPNYTITHQYQMQDLKADIHIEELKLVIEYQGKQHYMPVKHWGGEEEWKKLKERDERKASICKMRGLHLIYFTYQDTLTKNLVKNRIDASLYA